MARWGQVALMMVGLVSTGCGGEAAPEAYGNVEAVEVIVGAEVGGQLVSFHVNEGDKLTLGALVGAVDKTPIGLERESAAAQEATSASRLAEFAEQIQVLQAQRDAAVAQQDNLLAQQEVARRAYERTERLFSQQAATAQQMDQAERDLRTLGEQLKAQSAQIQAQERQMSAARAQQQTARRQVVSAQTQVAQIADRLQRTEIKNPVEGTVLAAYARRGEFVQPGQPLYKIADLDPVEVRAYVAQTQLAGLRVGQQALVAVDVAPGERRPVPGTVSWISAEAEFTPTPIQTREERADLVYAIKIRVPNPDGLLKIGMPADVQLTGVTATESK